MACEQMNAALVLNTCSSIGEATSRIAGYISLPILNIDAAMAREAVGRAARIGVLATLPTTLGPTMRLVKRSAEDAGKKVEIVDGLAEGAFDALISGDSEKHDRILAETAGRVADRADLIVLAQGSMARMEEELARQTGKPVLGSPRRGIEQVKRILEEESK
jgi:Asp/Glu/hydantoin racemase